MQERNRPQTFGQLGPGGLGDPMAPVSGPDGGLVEVSYGPYSEALPVGGMTVGEIRRRYRDRFDIQPDSRAVLGGADASDETVVTAGQQLSFSRRAGEKGGG